MRAINRLLSVFGLRLCKVSEWERLHREHKATEVCLNEAYGYLYELSQVIDDECDKERQRLN